MPRLVAKSWYADSAEYLATREVFPDLSTSRGTQPPPRMDAVKAPPSRVRRSHRPGDLLLRNIHLDPARTQ
jgi:hypothetical protein